MPFPPYMAPEQTENFRIRSYHSRSFSPEQVLTTVDSLVLYALCYPVEEKHELDRLFVWFPDQADCFLFVVREVFCWLYPVMISGVLLWEHG